MTEFVEKRTGWFGRAMGVLRSWERALEYTPYDYAIDRVGALEQEVLALRAEMSRLRAARDPTIRDATG